MEGFKQMQSTTTFQEITQGFHVCGLRSQAVELRVLPQLGAKLFSLRHLPSAREWMWSPTNDAPLFANALEDAFPQSTLVGGDECIPTIAPCRWRNRELPDHGEAWSQSWDWKLEDGALTTRLELPISPLSFQRVISLENETVHLRYTLQNLSDEPLEYIWALHPLMAIKDGDQIVLPSDCHRVRVDAAVGCALGERAAELDWPMPRPDVRLDDLDFGRPNCALKVFTSRLSQGKAAIHNRHSGEYLRFAFDVQELDTLGIWINRGGWAGHHHVAIEPTGGAPDALDVAVQEWRRFTHLEAGETRGWSLRLELGVAEKFTL